MEAVARVLRRSDRQIPRNICGIGGSTGHPPGGMLPILTLTLFISLFSNSYLNYNPTLIVFQDIDSLTYLELQAEYDVESADLCKVRWFKVDFVSTYCTHFIVMRALPLYPLLLSRSNLGYKRLQPQQRSQHAQKERDVALGFKPSLSLRFLLSNSPQAYSLSFTSIRLSVCLLHALIIDF